MRYVDEYRQLDSVRRSADALGTLARHNWTIMEVCGGQTHAIVRFGLDQLLPAGVSLVHGPGCPVCVTPTEIIDAAIELAGRPEVTLCSFGDMLRVPGTARDLATAKALGADVRIVYSPLDAAQVAKRCPDRQVVFFGVGFETTAPANAGAVFQAKLERIENFSVLVSQVLVPPAISALMESPDCRVQGFLAAGHVCTVMGCGEYEPLCRRYRVPIVVTGFEPLDIMQGITACVRQLEEGRADVENLYARSVRWDGNPAAQAIVRDVFEVVDRAWRGIGVIPGSGLALRAAYGSYDAEKRFDLRVARAPEQTECLSGLVLQGLRKPNECPAFARGCTPETPLGATMVSNEGACAAYYRYRRADARSGESPAGA